MSGAPASPESTLAIIIGASEFPRAQKLASGEPFAGAARDFREYLTDADGFALPPENLLDLFDSPKASSDLLFDIQEFLEERQKALAGEGRAAQDLVLFYVGHGGFASGGGGREYFLAVHSTRSDGEGGSGIRMSDLAGTLKKRTRNMRRYVILDCCFSAVAYKEFQSAPLEAAVVQAADALSFGEEPDGLPAAGTSLLCSSSAQEVSIAPAGAKHTMFSGALLDVLREGVPGVDRPLTLAETGRQVQLRLRRRYAADAVRPEVHSPDQREDEVKDVPLFPNPAHRRRNFDLTLIIAADRSLTLEFTGEAGKPEKVRGVLGYDPFAERTVRRLSEWINIGVRLGQEKENIWKGPLCEEDDLKLIGVNLFRMLFGQGEVREAFNRMYSRFREAYDAQATESGASDLRLRLRLAIHEDAQPVAQLPWELLFIPDADGGDSLPGDFFTGRRTELVLTRYVPRVAAAQSAPESGMLRILIAIYTPRGESGIKPQDRDSLISQFKAIRRAEVHVVEDLPLVAFERALREVRPHVLHFVGYGARNHHNHGGLALIGMPDDPEEHRYGAEDRTTLPLARQDLLDVLSNDDRLGVVFLHTCRSSLSSSTIHSVEAFRSQQALTECGRDLVFAGIPAVVAMQYAIADDEVATFASALYSELAQGRSMDAAVKAGRLILGGRFRPYWRHPRFVAPLVYLHTDDPLILPPGEGEQQAPTEAAHLQDRRGPVGVAGVGASTPRREDASLKPVPADRPSAFGSER